MMVIPIVFLLIGSLLYMALGTIREAALVFLCVPLALVGGALALLLRGMPFSVSAAVGFIAVSGVATLNGLVMMQAIQLELTRKNNEFLDRLNVVVSLDYLTRMEGTTGKEMNDLYTRMIGAQQ